MVGVVGNERRWLLLSSDPEANSTNSGDDQDHEDRDEDGQQELGPVFDIDADLMIKFIHLVGKKHQLFKDQPLVWPGTTHLNSKGEKITSTG